MSSITNGPVNHCTGHPRVRDQLSDAWRRLRRPLAPTLIAILITAAGAIAVFATTGLALATQQQTIERFNSPEGRLITLTDAQGNAGMAPATISLISHITGVAWVCGVSAAYPVTNPALPAAAPVTGRMYYGNLPPVLLRDNTRSLIPGQAIAATGLPHRLAMASTVGPLLSNDQPVTLVGTFTPQSPLGSLGDTVLIKGDDADTTHHLITVWVSVTNIAVLPQVSQAVSSAIVASSPGSVQVTTATGLTALSDTVSEGLARSAQRTVTGLLAAISVLIAAVQFGRVTGMVRDIGRRRALGASRSTITTAILLNATLCGVVGSIVGVVVGTLLTQHLAHALPPVAFTAGIGILVTLAAVVGSLPPAIRAARLDPVRILRVP